MGSAGLIGTGVLIQVIAALGKYVFCLPRAHAFASPPRGLCIAPVTSLGGLSEEKRWWRNGKYAKDRAYHRNRDRQ